MGRKDFDRDNFYPPEILALGKKAIRKMEQGRSEPAYNQVAYRTWRGYLLDLAVSSFKWEGLPPEIDPRFLEYALVTQGCVGFFAMRRGTAFWAVAPAVPSGPLNLYYNPNKVRLQPPTGGVPWYRHAYYYATGKYLMEPDALVCWDNKARRSFLPTIEYYARRLAHMERTIDVNVQAQQTPWIFTSDEQHRRDAENLALQLTGHSSVITMSDRAADFMGFAATQTPAPWVAENVQKMLQSLINQFCGIIGIDNSNTEKRERVSDKEATSNNEQVMLIRSSRLDLRRAFAQGIATMTEGVFEPTVSYAAPYREDGTVDMSWGGEER